MADYGSTRAYTRISNEVSIREYYKATHDLDSGDEHRAELEELCFRTSVCELINTPP